MGHIWAKTSFVDLMNFEIIGNDPKRTSTYVLSYTPPDLKQGGIDLQEVGQGTRLINLVIHDGNNNGVGIWSAVTGTEVHGCLIFNNGWFGADRPHGHGLYMQNLNTSPKIKIEDNIIFNNFVYGLQSYGSGDVTNNLDIKGNIFGRSGTPAGDNQPVLYLGAGLPATNLTLDDNFSWGRAEIGDAFGSKGNQNIAMNRNIFFSMNFYYWQNISGTGNRIYEVVGENVIAATPSRLDRTTNLVGGPRPTTGSEVFVRPNKFAPKRANIAIYNWGKAATVQVDLSSVLNPGDAFEVRDAYNFLGTPVLRGTYNGPVTIPMTGLTVASGIGFPAMPHTAPEFGVFVVLGK